MVGYLLHHAKQTFFRSGGSKHLGIRLGIIGFGYMGHWHLNNAPKVDDVKVVAAYDIVPEKVEEARSIGLRGYDKLEEFLADEEVNLVLVATPNEVHCSLACAAMNAGKNVICEKPVAMSLAEVDQMIETSKKNNVLFTVHQNRRWDVDFLAMKQIITDMKMEYAETLDEALKMADIAGKSITEFLRK